MGKKKHKKQKADDGQHAGPRDVAGPLAGIAAALAKKVDSPEGRQLLATGLTMAAAAASAALMKGAVHHHAAPAASEPPVPPRAPEAPVQPVPPIPPVPPVPPVPPHGTTTAPDPHAIGVALGKAAEQVLGAFLKPRPPG